MVFEKVINVALISRNNVAESINDVAGTTVITVRKNNRKLIRFECSLNLYRIHWIGINGEPTSQEFDHILMLLIDFVAETFGNREYFGYEHGNFWNYYSSHFDETLV